MFQDETIHLLKQLYDWLNVVDPTGIDEAKYLLLKKFSEVWMPLINTFPLTDYWDRWFSILADYWKKGLHSYQKGATWEAFSSFCSTS